MLTNRLRPHPLLVRPDELFEPMPRSLLTDSQHHGYQSQCPAMAPSWWPPLATPMVAHQPAVCTPSTPAATVARRGSAEPLPVQAFGCRWPPHATAHSLWPLSTVASCRPAPMAAPHGLCAPLLAVGTGVWWHLPVLETFWQRCTMVGLTYSSATMAVQHGALRARLECSRSPG